MEKERTFGMRMKSLGYNLLVSLLPILSMGVSIYTSHIHERLYVYEGDDYDCKVSEIAFWLFGVSVLLIIGNIIQGCLSWFKHFKESSGFMSFYRNWKIGVVCMSILIILWCQS